MLTLFMAGGIQQNGYLTADSLRTTYEAAVRRAFAREIDNGDPLLNRISTFATSYDEEVFEDLAFREAESAAKGPSRARIRAERVGADLSSAKPRTTDALRRDQHDGILRAAGVWTPEPGSRRLDFWDTGEHPLDAETFGESLCAICASKTSNPPTSPKGRHDILNAACFCELDRARAIGGAVCLLVAKVRELATENPDDPYARAVTRLCSKTIFRLLLREPRQVDSNVPQSIVPCTLFFLHDCGWLRSGAALLAQSAIWQVADVKDKDQLESIFRIFQEMFREGNVWLRKPQGVNYLLFGDGVVHALELIRTNDPHACSCA